MNIVKYIFIIFCFLISFASANEINLDGQVLRQTAPQIENKKEETTLSLTNRKEAAIVNCTREKYSSRCTSSNVSSDKMLNRNDLLFLTDKLYIDNYYRNFSYGISPFLNNSVYARAP